MRAIPAETLRGGDAGARFLAGQPALLSILDDVVLVGTNGKVVADMPALEGRRGLDLSDREHIARTLSTRRSYISQPYLGRATNAPSIAITVPVMSGTGQILGVISGSVSFLNPNFLGRLARETIGRAGYFFLVAKGETPIVILHPDRDRMMKPMTAANPEAERALRGWEGAEEGVDTKGVKLLLAYQPLRELEWVRAAALPSREAYDPLNSLIVRFAASGIALLAVDIDRFKGLNEMRGSDTGDAALKEVARRLSAAVCASDTVARLEGDNFVVILERLPLAGPGEDGTAGVKAASSVAEKVVACLRLPFVPAGLPVSITACAGLALQREGDTTDALLARAETALGEAKGAGRSVWRIAAGD